jgi:hypothetical protein
VRSRIAVDADAKRGLAILQACGLPLVEETKKIFKEVGLLQAAADESSTPTSTKDHNSRAPPKVFAMGEALLLLFTNFFDLIRLDLHLRNFFLDYHARLNAPCTHSSHVCP